MYIFFKRTFDIILSLIGITFLVPLYIIIRLAYICTGDFHHIIYAQTRIGRHGKPFKMFKFRSMVINADDELKKLLKNPKYKKEWDKYHKIENDPRITKVGRFLRKSSIDEMPQFINVFIGQMSVVGNRPYLPYEKSNIPPKEFNAIISTKPGITGLWQVSGRNDVDFKKRVAIEATYKEKCSILLDLKIIFKTISTIFKKSGAK